MFTAFKYRLYPNAAQKALLAKHFGCARFVYNKALNLKNEAWEERQENITRYQLGAMLPVWKKEVETEWLAIVNSQSLQSSLINLDMAFTSFFRRQTEHPKFKSKHGHQSFQVPQSGAAGAGFVKIPKLGKIKAAADRPPVGKIKTVTISKTVTGKYFAAVLCDDGLEEPAKLPVTEAGTIGVDLGIKEFAVLSTGERVANPRHLKKSLKRMRRAARMLSRRKKGSKNRDKARKTRAKIYEKVTNQRKDFLHKLSTRLVHDNQVTSLAIEDLAVSNLLKNPRLARHISDVGWGNFRSMLEYKAARTGKNILVIGRFAPSTKMCSCGVLNHALTLKDRVWTCASCGTTHDRDLNAARNIKRFALHPQNFIGRGTPEFYAWGERL